MADAFTFRVEGLSETLNYFKLLAEDKFPKVQSLVCNDLAFMVRTAEMETMQSVFKTPRPQTIRNIKVFKGNESRPGATVAFNQIYDGEEYMAAQVEGGRRSMKRSELRLGQTYYVPGIGAQMDQYGNMKGSQLTQILSQLGRFPQQGYQMNKTAKSIKRNVNGPQYFVLWTKANGLAAGVYLRVDKGQGQMLVARALANKGRGETRASIKAAYRKSLVRGIVPALIFVKKKPTYKKLFPFFEVANRVVDANYKSMMSKWIDTALR